jgi:predicted permease
VFTVVAVLSLALGIGANTAMFTVVKSLFLQAPFLRDPASVVSLVTADASNAGVFPVSYPNYEDIEKRQTMFGSTAILSPANVMVDRGSADPMPMIAELVSGSFFSLAGVPAAFGRVFTAAETNGQGAGPYAVLSHSGWEQHFGANPRILGTTIGVNRSRFTIIGVMPRNFKGFNTVTEPAIWLPMSFYRLIMPRPEALDDRRAMYFYPFARLKEGITREQAEAALAPLSRQLEREHPLVNRGRSLKLTPSSETAINRNLRILVEKSSVVLMIVVGLVLLIACANVASLLILRAKSRSKEFAIRLAIGAGPWRLGRQLLTESLLLAMVGGGLGLLFGRWLRDLLWGVRPYMLNAVALDISLDLTVFAFTLGVSLLAGLLFGLAPALQAWRQDLATELKERSVRFLGAPHGISTRNLLVVAQCAFSLTAIVGAGLFLESLRRASHFNPGFESERLATVRLNLASEGYSKQRGLEFHRQLQERIGSLSSVRMVSVSSIDPMASGGFLRNMFIEGRDPSAPPVLMLMNAVGLRYFETAGIKLIEGRDFTASDRESTPMVVIVNESFAKRYWPGKSAIGQRVRFSSDAAPREIVGVAGDSKFFTLNEEYRPCVFIPLLQEYLPVVTLLVRTREAPEAVLGSIREEIKRLDAGIPVPRIYTIGWLIRNSLWPQLTLAALLGIFGLVGLALAAVGVYGITAYSVSQRVSEIGIRLALGASGRDVLRLIVGQGMLLVATGAVVGAVASLASSRIAAGLLFGVGATHPPTYILAALVLLVVALIACLIPARRAMRIDPLLALRHE